MTARNIALLTASVLLTTPGSAQQGRPPKVPLQLRVYQVSKADVSPPLRQIGPPVQPAARRQRPLLRLTVGGSQTASRDTVTQTSAQALGTLSSAANFEGLSVDTYSPAVAPPDENLAVGPNHIVQLVNVQMGVFDKATGALLAGFPKPINSIWSGFSGACETHNDGDPIVRYDRQAQRWIITQLTADFNLLNFHECLAVSQTEDPTGAYYRYDVDFGYRLQDYPKFGLWPDGWYMSANSFIFGLLLEGSNMCAWERSKLLIGDRTAKVICVVTGSADFAGLLPSDWDGNASPPAGSPNYFIEIYSTTSMAMFSMKPNYQNPSSSVVTGPVYIDVAPFNLPCGGGDCIPQQDSTQLLASLGDRLMYRLAYRNLGAHESIVVNHAVAANNTVGMRWYEIRSPGGTPVVYQQATYVPDSDYRWMASMAMDKAGNVATGYSKSGPGMYPGIFLTGREAGDAPGTLRAEQPVWSGTGSQQPDLNRWGDYSSIETDPLDDCTFWYTSQYLPANGTFNWRTRIASFKFSSCGQTLTPTTTTLTSAPNPSTYGQSVSFTATVTPPSGTATPTGSVTFKDGAATLGSSQLDPSGHATYTTSSLSAGSHSITAVYGGDTAFSGSTSPPVAQTVNKVATTTTLSSSANPSTQGQSVTFTATVSPSAATGNVQFFDGTTSLGTASLSGGIASLSTSSLSVGSHSITAAYSGDGNYASSTSPVLAQTVNAALSADLALSMTAKPNPAVIGKPVTYTIKATNNGPGGATGVTITDTLPGSLTYVSASSSCTGTLTVTCTIGSLASGGTASVTITVKPNVTGVITNTASVSGAQPDPNTVNNTASASINVKKK